MIRLPFFVQSVDGCEQAPKYLVVKGSGGAGLGDKIRALAVGILLAKVTGRTLWVDWDDRTYGGQRGNLFPHLFLVKGISTIESCPVAALAKPDIWRGYLAISQDQMRADDLHSRGIEWTGAAPPWDPQEAMRRYSWDVSNLSEPAGAVVLTTMLSAGPALSALRGVGVVPQDYSQEFVLEQCLRDHLRTSAIVGQKIERFRAAHHWERRFVIGVHVRHSQESAVARTMPAISEYFAAADRALARYRDADIFLSTDNRDVVGWFRGRYGEARVIVTDKWFAQPGQSLHKNPLCPDGIGSAQEAVVDMGLLASCDFLITLGNSSFSIVANALSVAAPDDRTILHPRNPIWWRVLRRLGLGNRG